MRARGPFLSTLLITLATGWAGPISAQDGPSGALTIDDVVDLAQVQSPQLSPDGTRVLYTKRELDWDENKREGRIWIVGSDGLGARVFTGSSDDQNPRWSPDGRWVSFTRPVGDSDKVRQIFLLPTDGGEAIQLTKHTTNVGAYEWDEEGRVLYFQANDSLPDDVEKERKKGDDTVFIDEGPNGQTRGSWNGVWRVAAAPGPEPVDAERITPEERRIGDFAVSPDGNHLAYTYRQENRRNDGFLSELVLRSLATGEEVALTDNEAPESGLAWSPDGRILTYVAPDLEEWALDQGNLYAYDIPHERTRQLMEDFQPDMRGYDWAPGGDHIHFVALDRTDAHLYRLDVASGEVEPLTEGVGILSAPSFDRTHGSVAFLRSGPTAAGDVWFRDLESGQERRLTTANPGLAEKTLVEPEVVRWTSADGLEIEGLLYQPERAQPGAMVLEIHGGPAGVFSRTFDTDAQLLVAAGYAVLQPNVRGSSGYGDELLRGNMNDIGGGDFQDLMTGVDAMIERGVAHPDSLAVKGWSYGGILGGWTITQTDRFKAASLGAMVADWSSEFGTGFNFDVVRWYLGGDPWSNSEMWRERSAYSHLDQVSTPTILFHGAEDRTDTMEQSMNFFAGLRHLGVEARFLLFPREGHGIQEPRHRRTLMVEEMRWIHRYVKGLEDWTPPERPSDDEKKDAVIS